MPEVLWKAYIDFEVEQEEYQNTRKLYRRLLERTQHVKVCQPIRDASYSSFNADWLGSLYVNIKQLASSCCIVQQFLAFVLAVLLKLQ